jgi:hypothetical protein
MTMALKSQSTWRISVRSLPADSLTRWRAIVEGGKIMQAKPNWRKELRTIRERRLVYKFALANRMHYINGEFEYQMSDEEFLAYAENKLRELAERKANPNE